MAFFTRTKAIIPIPPDEEGEISEDDWEEDLEERRTPDGRSSKTSYELRREPTNQTSPEAISTQLEQVVECKNPCLKPEACYDNLAKRNEELKISEATETEAKTEDVRYEFVVDRVLGVQV